MLMRFLYDSKFKFYLFKKENCKNYKNYKSRLCGDNVHDFVLNCTIL